MSAFQAAGNSKGRRKDGHPAQLSQLPLKTCQATLRSIPAYLSSATAHNRRAWKTFCSHKACKTTRLRLARKRKGRDAASFSHNSLLIWTNAQRPSVFSRKCWVDPFQTIPFLAATHSWLSHPRLLRASVDDLHPGATGQSRCIALREVSGTWHWWLSPQSKPWLRADKP